MERGRKKKKKRGIQRDARDHGPRGRESKILCSHNRMMKRSAFSTSNPKPPLLLRAVHSPANHAPCPSSLLKLKKSPHFFFFFTVSIFSLLCVNN